MGRGEEEGIREWGGGYVTIINEKKFAGGILSKNQRLGESMDQAQEMRGGKKKKEHSSQGQCF